MRICLTCLELCTSHDGAYAGAKAGVLSLNQSVLAFFHILSAECVVKPIHLDSDPACHLHSAVCAIICTLEHNSFCTIFVAFSQLTHLHATCELLADLSYKELSGRPKNLWGVYNKMQQKCQKLDSIYDLRAIRVIVRDKTDCYAVLRQVGLQWQ